MTRATVATWVTRVTGYMIDMVDRGDMVKHRATWLTVDRGDMVDMSHMPQPLHLFPYAVLLDGHRGGKFGI